MRVEKNVFAIVISTSAAVRTRRSPRRLKRFVRTVLPPGRIPSFHPDLSSQYGRLHPSGRTAGHFAAPMRQSPGAWTRIYRLVTVCSTRCGSIRNHERDSVRLSRETQPHFKQTFVGGFRCTGPACFHDALRNSQSYPVFPTLLRTNEYNQLPQTTSVYPVSLSAIRLCRTVTFAIAVERSPHGLCHYFPSQPESAHSTLTQLPHSLPSPLWLIPLSPVFLSGTPRHSSLSASFTRFFLSPFLYNLLLTETGFPLAPKESLLRSRWYMPEVSPVGVGRPNVRLLATLSLRIWSVPTCRLEEPDTGRLCVRSPRQ